MKSLIVFFSIDGNTRYIAKLIAQQMDADLLELKTKKKFPQEGFAKYFWAGKSAFFKEKPKLTNTLPDISGYDRLIIGTPIWVGTYSSPVNTFISKACVKNKKVAFFACSAGGDTNKCFEQLKKRFKDNSIIGTIGFMDPLKGNKKEIIAQINEWVSRIE